MNPLVQGQVFLVLTAVSAIMTATIARLAITRSGSSLTRLFVTVMVLELAWMVLLVLETLAPGLDLKLFFDGLQYPVSLAIPLFFYMLARGFLNQPPLPKMLRWLVFLPVLLSLPLVLTSPLHGWLRAAPTLASSNQVFGELVYRFTFLDYLLFFYCYAFFLLGLLTLGAGVAQAKRKIRKQALVLLSGFILPCIGITLALLDFRLLGRRDSSPLWFALGNPIIALAVFRFRLFDILPVARKHVVDILGDPILMFDDDGLLLDCNTACAALLCTGKSELRGRRVETVLQAWPDAAQLLLDPQKDKAGRESDNIVTDIRTARVYRVSVNSVSAESGDDGGTLCWVAIFTDISDMVTVERELQNWNVQLESRIADRLKDLEQEVARRRAAEDGLRRMGDRIVKSQQEILVTLSEVVENRSPETANHVLRVAEYSRILAQAQGLSAEGTALIMEAAPLHDVGKIAIPDAILNKPGPLSDEEMQLMKTHTIVGYQILQASQRSMIRAAAVIALDHHEHWDGSGYPYGKAGEAISLSGRIVAICDVFDALTTARSYKQAWDIQRTLEFFRNESGKKFDPRLTELFFAHVEDFLEVSRRFPETVSAAVPGF